MKTNFHYKHLQHVICRHIAFHILFHHWPSIIIITVTRKRIPMTRANDERQTMMAPETYGSINIYHK